VLLIALVEWLHPLRPFPFLHIVLVRNLIVASVYFSESDVKESVVASLDGWDWSRLSRLDFPGQ